MNESLLRSCRKKSRLLKVYKKIGTNVARLKYVKYKNTLKQALRHEEKKYYEDQFMSKAHDSRNTWKLINTILNKTNKDDLPHSFSLDAVNTTDKNLIVNMFNKYFVHLGSNLAKNIIGEGGMLSYFSL